MFLESKVGHIVPFRTPGTIQELEKNVALRINSQNKNFIIEEREREQAVRIRKEKIENEQRVKKALEDQQREARVERNREKRQANAFVASSFMQFLGQQERKESRARKELQTRDCIQVKEEAVISDQ